MGQPRGERVVKLFDRIDHEDLDEATLLTVREQIAILSAPSTRRPTTSEYKPATGSWISPPGCGRRCCLSCKAY
jgi:hypothetical protein